MHNYLLASQHKKGCPPQWNLTRDILTCDFRHGFWLFWCKSETMADGKQRAKGFCYCIILLERETGFILCSYYEVAFRLMVEDLRL